MRARLIGTAALTGALALGAAGCGGSNPKPSPVTESTNSGSPKASSSLSTSATRLDSEGAKAYVTYYVSLINLAQQSGDTDALKKESANCSGCEAIYTKIDRVYGKGGSITGLAWSAKGLRTQRSGKKTIVISQLTVSSGSIDPSSEAREVTDFEAAPPRETQFGLATSEDRWVLTDLVQP